MLLFLDPRCFLPVTVYGTTHAHLVHMCWPLGPSPNGPQFCHIRYIRPRGVTEVDHESAQFSRLEAVAIASPKSLELRTLPPSQPQTLAQPTQPTVVANVNRKCCLQSTLDAFLKPNPTVTDDVTDDIVQSTGGANTPKRPLSPTITEDEVSVSAVKGVTKCHPKALRLS